MFEETRRDFFPAEIVPGISARPLENRDDLWDIISPLMSEVFTPFAELGAYEMPDARWEQIRPLRDVFAQTHREQFVFYNEQGEPVGWSYGEMLESETFFMANTAILPAYRRRGLYSAFLKQFLAYLGALGYERVTSKHQTNNAPVIIAKLKLGFVIVGLDLDERWGAQVELAYFFHDDRRRGYERAYALQSDWTFLPTARHC
jgi:RimJ/RimL family protein N-acetyltransferase